MKALLTGTPETHEIDDPPCAGLGRSQPHRSDQRHGELERIAVGRLRHDFDLRGELHLDLAARRQRWLDRRRLTVDVAVMSPGKARFVTASQYAKRRISGVAASASRSSPPSTVAR